MEGARGSLQALAGATAVWRPQALSHTHPPTHPLRAPNRRAQGEPPRFPVRASIRARLPVCTWHRCRGQQKRKRPRAHGHAHRDWLVDVWVQATVYEVSRQVSESTTNMSAPLPPPSPPAPPPMRTFTPTPSTAARHALGTGSLQRAASHRARRGKGAQLESAMLPVYTSQYYCGAVEDLLEGDVDRRGAFEAVGGARLRLCRRRAEAAGAQAAPPSSLLVLLGFLLLAAAGEVAP